MGECAHQLSLPATPDSHIHLRPRGSGQRSWTQGRAQHDQGGKQKANGGKLAFIRAVQAFTCHGAVVPPPILIQLTFTSQRSLLWYFLGLQESTVLPVSSPSPPPSPPPPLPIKKASPRLSGPASLQYEILAGKAAHYSALSTYMATNSTLSTYISTGTSLTLPRHTLITV